MQTSYNRIYLVPLGIRAQMFLSLQAVKISHNLLDIKLVNKNML